MSNFSKYGSFVDVAFAAGAATSSAVDLRQLLHADGTPDVGELRLIGFKIPSGWVAAPLTLLHSLDGGVTYQSMYDATGVEYQMTVVAGSYTLLMPSDLIGISNFKLQSGTTSAQVTQPSAVTVRANLRRFE